MRGGVFLKLTIFHTLASHDHIEYIAAARSVMGRVARFARWSLVGGVVISQVCEMSGQQPQLQDKDIRISANYSLVDLLQIENLKEKMQSVHAKHDRLGQMGLQVLFRIQWPFVLRPAQPQ